MRLFLCVILDPQFANEVDIGLPLREKLLSGQSYMARLRIVKFFNNSGLTVAVTIFPLQWTETADP